MVPSALTHLRLPAAPAAALVALSLVWLVLALDSVASKGGTGCRQAPTGSVRRRGCWGPGQFSLLLGREMEEDTRLLVPGAVGPLATPLLLLLRLQVFRGREEAPGCVGRVDGWESGDLVGPGFAPQAGAFPSGSWFSYL